jgi:hypothetical protein
MNVFTHDEYIRGQIRAARRMQWIGLALVFVSMVLAFWPTENYLTIFLAYPFLLAGLPIWTAARATQRRLGQSARVYQLINNELKGLSNKYSLHHYPMVEGTPISHLLVGPQGLIVLLSSQAAGPVTCRGGPRGDVWRSKSGLLDKMTGLNPPVGNPSKGLDEAISAARQLLQKLGKPNVPVRGVVVFTGNPQIFVDGCSYRAVPLHELRQTVQELLGDMEADAKRDADARQRLEAVLTSDDRRRINALLNPAPAVVVPKPASVRR